MNRPIGVWFTSFALSAVSLEGIWSYPNVLSSSKTTAQYFVAASDIVYIIAGFLIVTGIWQSNHSTWLAVIVWGFASLGAAIGGPLAFGPTTATTHLSIIVMTIAVLLITSGLLCYVRRITRVLG